jgi:mannose-6-phosphate isomerase-like protein (cupin superfamily)
MKIDIKEFAGKVRPIRESDIYSVHDLEYLKRLNVSMTILHPGKATTGHEHEETDEVYIVMDGKGELQLEEKRIKVETGDIILIKGGEFHKTFNPTKEDLVFICIFEKYAGRGKKAKKEKSLERLLESAEKM